MQEDAALRRAVRWAARCTRYEQESEFGSNDLNSAAWQPGALHIPLRSETLSEGRSNSGSGVAAPPVGGAMMCSPLMLSSSVRSRSQIVTSGRHVPDALDY
jgi:hypothetical protein